MRLYPTLDQTNETPSQYGPNVTDAPLDGELSWAGTQNTHVVAWVMLAIAIAVIMRASTAVLTHLHASLTASSLFLF